MRYGQDLCTQLLPGPFTSPGPRDRSLTYTPVGKDFIEPSLGLLLPEQNSVFRMFKNKILGLQTATSPHWLCGLV